MQERLLKVIKLFFISLGVIFLVILLLSFVAFFSLSKLPYEHNTLSNNAAKLKQIQPIIDYVEDYQNKNGKYPKALGEIKINKKIEYKYETSNDSNCYTITSSSKKHNSTQKYQRCLIKTDNYTSFSENYSEFSN